MAKVGSRTHQVMVSVLKEQLRYEEDNQFFCKAFGYERSRNAGQRKIMDESNAMTAPLNEARLRWAQRRLAEYRVTGELLPV